MLFVKKRRCFSKPVKVCWLDYSRGDRFWVCEGVRGKRARVRLVCERVCINRCVWKARAPQWDLFWSPSSLVWLGAAPAAYWNARLLIYSHPRLIWGHRIRFTDVSVLLFFPVFFVISCGIRLISPNLPRNPPFIDCSVIQQSKPWLFNWLWNLSEEWGVRRRGDSPSSSEESLMSQNWSDIITQNYSSFWKINGVCVFSQHQILFA